MQVHESVTGSARLDRGDAAEEVARIKRETEGKINVGVDTRTFASGIVSVRYGVDDR